MYSFDSRVRYSEVNTNKKLDLSSIINYFQDCSTFHSEDIGLGMDFLEQEQHVWILNSWQIIVNQFPSFGEQITIGTWAYDFNAMYGYRNFIMKSEQGDILACANSVWVLMDMNANRPIKIGPADINGYALEEKLDMEYAPRKIAMPKEMTTFDAFHVVKSNIDTNNHVNNCQYIKMAEEYLPKDFVITQMRAEYKKSALLGDTIVPHLAVSDHTYTIVLANEENKPYCIVEFK